VSFNKLVLPNGNTYYIVGSLASLEDGKDVDDESRLKGKSTTKRNVLFIGGGAGVGAIIGAAAGGGSGAAIGGAIGAGAGTAAALLMKGHEAEAKAGTDIGMTLDREVAIVVKR
jgi:outer membrane lipoprotein SlyB